MDLSSYSTEELKNMAGITKSEVQKLICDSDLISFIDWCVWIFNIIWPITKTILCALFIIGISIYIYEEYILEKNKLNRVQKIIKNIIVVSYLKNKGYRRICFVIGSLLSIFPLLESILFFDIEYLIIGLILLYLPFFVACIIKWIVQGFKSSKKVHKK